MSEKPWIEIISDKHFSDASKTRPESKENFNWFDLSLPELAAEIQRRCENFDSLLEACKEMEDALECCEDIEDWRDKVMGPAREKLQAAISSAEKQP